MIALASHGDCRQSKSFFVILDNNISAENKSKKPRLRILMFSFSTVIYVCKGEDGTIIERKGSKEEPFKFTTHEGMLFLLHTSTY